MASHVPPLLSTGETLRLFCLKVPLALVRFLCDYTRRSAVALAHGHVGVTTFKRNLVNSIGPLMMTFSTREMQFMQRRTTGNAVRAYARSTGLPLRSVTLKDAAADGFAPGTLHILDLPVGEGSTTKGKPATTDDADATDDEGPRRPVLLFLHGGAYIAPLSAVKPAHIMAEQMEARQLAILEYGLAPANTYPTQLSQGVAALRYLAAAEEARSHGNENGNGYADIVIEGESAGANLALGLLAHMQQPHPQIRPLAAGAPLRGVLAVSARTTIAPMRPSHQTNASKDMLSRASMQRVTDDWQPTVDDVWAAPDLGSRAFWAGLGRHTHSVRLLAGGDEIYRDDIVYTADMMQGNNKVGTDAAVDVVVCPGETHVQAVVDIALGIRGGCMRTAAMRWAVEMRDRRP